MNKRGISMKDNKQTHRRLGSLIAGVGIIGALYGWIVYAGEIEIDIANNIQAITTQSNNLVIVDPIRVKGMEDKENTAETLRNNIVSQELYGTPLNGMTSDDAALTKHFGSYCTNNSSFEKGSNCTDDPLLQFGDVKLSSILAGTVYDAPRTQAALDFLTNLLNPSAAPGVASFSANAPVDAAKIAADPDLKKKYVAALMEETLLSTIRQPFTEMMAKRTVLPSGNQSEMQIMEQQAIQRFANAGWATKIKTMTPAELQQEQALMQAYQVWLEYQRYRQTERVETLLAVLALQNFRSAKAMQQKLDNAQPSQADIDSTLQKNGGASSGASQPSTPADVPVD